MADLFLDRGPIYLWIGGRSIFGLGADLSSDRGPIYFWIGLSFTKTFPIII